MLKKGVSSRGRLLSGMRNHDMYASVCMLLLFKCCLYASFWYCGEKILLPVLKLQLQGRLSAIYSNLVFYYYSIIAPQGDARLKGT